MKTDHIMFVQDINALQVTEKVIVDLNKKIFLSVKYQVKSNEK